MEVVEWMVVVDMVVDVELEEVVIGVDVVEMGVLVVTGVDDMLMVKVLAGIPASSQGGSGPHVGTPGMVVIVKVATPASRHSMVTLAIIISPSPSGLAPPKFGTTTIRVPSPPVFAPPGVAPGHASQPGTAK